MVMFREERNREGATEYFSMEPRAFSKWSGARITET